MNCPLHINEGAEILLDYCSHRMDPDRASEFRLHVADCVDCKQVVDAQEAVWNALDSYEAMPVSMDFDRKLWARIDSEEQQSWFHRAMARFVDGPAIGWYNTLFNWKPMMAGATACAALATVMMVYTPAGSIPSDQPVMDQKIVEHVESALDDVDMLNQVGVLETAHPVGGQ